MGRDWDERLLEALWAYRTSYRVTTKSTPFSLVYGEEAIFPIEKEVPTLRVAIEARMGVEESLKERYIQLVKLEEKRLIAQQSLEAIQKGRKERHDKNLKTYVIQEGDLVLVYDSKYYKFPGKLQTRWAGPFKVVELNSNGSMQIQDLGEEYAPVKVNALRVKPYFK
ncbi:hypothetical protein KP509_13G012900 [Ceratopteris richardii]|uniref:Uncharacterized protein n=1 Tax=Ceratopteris richardii TaxID=49495 RepID=A0A8T2TFJ3_CERRI|nr:hypothetical protein KP509_13G012900 [Ceratopteris richardii]